MRLFGYLMLFDHGVVAVGPCFTVKFGSGKAKDLRLTCELNKAACYLKLQMFAEAKTACRIVLDEQGQNVKALFRRAQVWGDVRKWQWFNLEEWDIVGYYGISCPKVSTSCAGLIPTWVFKFPGFSRFEGLQLFLVSCENRHFLIF